MVKYAQDRKIKLLLDDIPAGAELVVSSENGESSSSFVLPKSNENGVFEAKLPDFADALVIKAGGTQSKVYPLKQQPGSTSVYKVDIDSRFWSGFLRALGADVNPYSIEVDTVSR